MFKNGLKITSKYHNKKIKTPDGVFDSQRELRDWNSLKEKEAKGEITQLQRQVSFDLIPTIKTNEETLSKIKYKADFFYYDLIIKKYVIYESKGFSTPEWKLKKRLLLMLIQNKKDFLFIEVNKSQKKVYTKILTDNIYKIALG